MVRPEFIYYYPEFIQIPNLMFGTFYCTGATDVKEFKSIIRKMPQYFIIVLCESPRDKVAIALRTSDIFKEEDSPSVAYCAGTPVFLVYHKYRVQTASLKIPQSLGDVSYMLADYSVAFIKTENMDTAVAVGIVNVHPSADRIRHKTKDAIITSLRVDRVRCITGVFGRCRADLETLFRYVPLPVPVVRTSFRSADVEEVFPSYIIFLGSCNDSTFPEWTSTDASSMDIARASGWAPDIQHFRASEVLPYAGERRGESAVADLWHFTQDINWGHIKSKPLAPLRQMKGVHQVVVWCGTATQGRKAKIRGAKKRKGR